MFNNPQELRVLNYVLSPLLEDFQYWFERSRTLLEEHPIAFLGDEKQADLLGRIKQAQQEVRTAQMLLDITNAQIGLETEILILWHRLVTECWQVSIRYRLEYSIASDQSSD